MLKDLRRFSCFKCGKKLAFVDPKNVAELSLMGRMGWDCRNGIWACKHCKGYLVNHKDDARNRKNNGSAS